MPKGKPRRARFTTTKAPSKGITHPGTLLSVGYNLGESDAARHRGLVKSVGEYGYLKTVERVNDLAVLNKNHSGTHAKLEGDLAWLRDHAYTREPSKDTAGGPAFVSKAGRVSVDRIPEGGFRVWKD